MIEYRKGYKYWLAADYRYELPFDPGETVETEFYLLIGNVLRIRRGYAWDGSSGPAVDSRVGLRASLVHDVLCQMVQEELVDPKWKSAIDKVYVSILEENGMLGIVRWWRGLALSLHRWEKSGRNRVLLAP